MVADTVAVVENAKYGKTLGNVKAKHWLTRWLTHGRSLKLRQLATNIRVLKECCHKNVIA